jgi:hypothetical protein
VLNKVWHKQVSKEVRYVIAGPLIIQTVWSSKYTLQKNPFLGKVSERDGSPFALLQCWSTDLQRTCWSKYEENNETLCREGTLL